MIGFDYLGKMGRLCNQMFQYAAVRGISENRGYDFCIPSSFGEDEWNDHRLFQCFEMNSNVGVLGTQYIQESSFRFDKKLFDECPDNISLVGYFQTEKYFIHIKNEIKSDFKFNEYILSSCKDAIDSLGKKPVALHIRRTDFQTNPNHHCLPIEYYEEALKHFDNNREVVIFTDDSSWCKSQEIFKPDRFLISEGQDAYHDLCSMTLCDGHIIANSTYSWWGAWLSESEKVIAPKDWFGDSENKHLDTTDIIPERWIKI